MAAYARSTAGGGTSGTGNRTVTVTTAVSGSLLVAFVSLSANTTTTPTMTDDHADGLGTWTRVGTALWSASANNSAVFIRNALLGSTDTSFIVTCTSGSNTAGAIVVVELTGMVRAGADALRSSGSQANQALGGTPTPVLSQTCLTSSITLVAVMSGDTTTTPPTGWTERQEVGQATPTTRLEVATRDSGFTGTSIAFGATCSTAFASWALELYGADKMLTEAVALSDATLRATAKLYLEAVLMAADIVQLEGPTALILIDHRAITFNGSQNFESAAPVLIGKTLTFRLARCTTATPLFWPDAGTIFSFMASMSSDAGQTWQDLAGGSSGGGISQNPDEDIPGEQAELVFVCKVPDGANRVRIAASTTATLRSELTVEVR